MASDVDKNDFPLFHEFSHHLTNTTDIVENILVYLNARELNRSARVCSFWAKIVKRLKRKRKTRSWTCLHNISDEDDTTSDAVVQTQNFIQGLYTEPDVVFVISTADLLHMKTGLAGQTRSGRLTRGVTQTYQEFVCSLLPQSCKLCGIESNGIIGTTSDCRESIEVERYMKVI
ncbi:uncharacterized protein LOC132740997 [Ruditapes philippinarum]|uniref:uncharacterized protein LOC132740997 n=1 Tax=Ruditapes philippinarum TaxID=129788 RepID=UPI00295A8249|nr:uncharacterized protein LOC132740997 [Ruditapes philippinarum]